MSQNLECILAMSTGRRVLEGEMESTTVVEHRGHSSAADSETDIVYRESVFKVTMIFVSVLLCLLMLVVCWDSIVRCRLCRRWRASDHSPPQPESVRASKTGLSKMDVDKLPMIRCTASSSQQHYQGLGGECMICLNEFSEGDKVRLLPSCGHAFHVSCIDLWLLTNASCPACRQSLLPQVSPSNFVRDQSQLHGVDEGAAVANNVTRSEQV
ncbi:hypothetical protein O6H91_11G112500 [Diphasiastrum complanatum]|uniref:Uncharacterized protein n=2 Tax=Diphasiastrum complanatum TaxID=34168 RepID=A0ACC2CDA9_DIPCM|nr:hypothetical protein O6H91_11G112400 [Diphasiastrum complanatum]KAJ7539858.1 hypothetical protein O6H91_11G112500 [Diphasiastrum complanatum]